MNKDYKNFNGNLTADLDLDSEKDFVNQGGSFSMDELLSDLESYGQEGGTTVQDIITDSSTGATATQATQGMPTVQDVLDDRRRANRGKGIGSFAKGLGQGLSLLRPAQQAPPAIDPNASRAGVGIENRNPVIPILIGLIGIAVLVFAISKTKKGQPSPMPTS